MRFPHFFLIIFSSFSLPSAAQINDTLILSGLLAPVEVLRDEWGVNHIYAQNEQDLFFAQVYCAAKDRLFLFEMWRRQATGTMAQLFGAEELQRDIGSRLFSYRGDMQKELSHYHTRGKEIITAFVNGVNAFIRECIDRPESLPVEFRLLGILPGYWTSETVVSRHQGIRSNVLLELNMARAIINSGEEKVRSLMWFHPEQPDLKIDPSLDTSLFSRDLLGLYRAVNKELTISKEHVVNKASEEGSNNWVIAGSRTASGYPLIANDPHRKISVPSLRYIVHLNAPGWDVIGGGEPVIPGVSIGHNSHGAWGLTIFETDAEDMYVYDLRPDDPLQYRYKDGWRKMEVVQERFHIKNGKDTLIDLYFTHHGPVTFIDRKKNKAVAVRCAWLEPGGAPYLASLRMDQSTNWDEFREACSFNHIPGENMVWADRKGNIGWQAVGITPIRKSHSGMVPVPGNGEYEWQGFLPIKERPHLLNPSTGFFATANQHVTPSNYPFKQTISYTWADAFRGDRVNEVLQRSKKATIDDSKELQCDYTSLPARVLVPRLRSLSFNDPMEVFAKEKLLQWDLVLDTFSVAAAIYIMWEREISSMAEKRFVPPSIAPFISLQLTRILQWIVDPLLVFREQPAEERDTFLKDCFQAAIKKLQNKLGNDISQWRYGQPLMKHIEIRHPLSQWVDTALRSKLDFGPMPRGGYGLTPGATGMSDNQTVGASFRFIADLADWDNAVLTNTPGQSGNPASPFYRNLFNDWANDRYFPALFTKEKILSHLHMQTKLFPAVSHTDQ